MGNLVVARFLNGKVEKGKVFHFDPNKAYFPLKYEDRPYEEGRFIPFSELKAVFFVKDLKGNPDYHSSVGVKELREEKKPGRKLAITFKDGETIYALAYELDRYDKGFFAFPIDPEDNNDRIFVLRHAIQKLEEIEE